MSHYYCYICFSIEEFQIFVMNCVFSGYWVYSNWARGCIVCWQSEMLSGWLTLIYILYYLAFANLLLMAKPVGFWTIVGFDFICCLWQAFPGHRGPVSSLVFREGSTELFSGSFDRTVKIWNVEDRTYMNTLFGHQSEVLSIDCLRKERVLAAGRDRSMQLFKVISPRWSIKYLAALHRSDVLYFLRPLLRCGKLFSGLLIQKFFAYHRRLFLGLLPYPH
jgi:WD40 repeat protein